MDPELWPTSRVREFLGYRSAAAARGWLGRHKIPAATDQAGRILRDPGTDEKLYPADVVQRTYDRRARPTYRRAPQGAKKESK